MEDLVQLVGAVLILIGFIAAQRGLMSPQSLTYLWLNLVGSAVLAVIALIGSDWGFLLLEGVWAIVSAGALVERARGHSTAPTAD